MASPASAGSAKPHESKRPLSEEELRKMHAYWRAANYLSVGQIYLYANPGRRPPMTQPARLDVFDFPGLMHQWISVEGNFPHDKVVRSPSRGMPFPLVFF